MLEAADYSRRFSFVEGDLTDVSLLDSLFEEHAFDIVVNLAAQAGVRHSIDNPRAYIDSNLIGFFNILEMCRKFPVEHLVYASSSSVYGGNEKVPFSETDCVDDPVSLYAATKKSDELLAAAYSNLYKIPCTGLRFFTVYGPMGRPDMAYFGFTDKLVQGKRIEIFNMGNCQRDFTYIDDVVTGIELVLCRPPEAVESRSGVPAGLHRVYNIGNSQPVGLLEFVETLKRALVDEGILPKDFNLDAYCDLVPMQPGDVPITYADTSALERDFGYRPATPLSFGLHEFARWYGQYRLGSTDRAS